jgi:hypothetical protein
LLNLTKYIRNYYLNAIYNNIEGGNKFLNLKFSGFAVDLWRPGSGHNPEELGTYTQGDMLIPNADTERNGIFGTNYRWPGGIVYYEIEKDDFSKLFLCFVIIAKKFFKKH